MSSQIFLCTPPSPPYTCRAYFPTHAATIAHLATHGGFADFRRQHGHAGVSAIPVRATLHREPYPAAGLQVWVCSSCTLYFTSNIAAVMHLQDEAGHADVEALVEQLGLAGFYEHVRREHGRMLVVHGNRIEIQMQMPEAPIPVARRLAVNSPDGQQRVVVVPLGTRTRGALAEVVAGEVDWTQGLVVRYVTAGGEPQGAVLRTDQDVEGFVDRMRMGECWVGEGQRM